LLPRSTRNLPSIEKQIKRKLQSSAMQPPDHSNGLVFTL
jgi:hypothetical protein